jgi:hypothetical protein
MAVVELITLHTKPGASQEEIQRQVKRGIDIGRKYGAENVTTMVGVVGGTGTGSMIIMSTHADFASYGRYLEGLTTDPDLWAVIDDPSNPVISWDTCAYQTIPDL